ncbi:hypothetical protein E5F05_01935 (plasmid) [Deinococcus metallilatus]|uniref:Intein C-terminal splicing domain-containing protein n=1 Tax=Deinococcus metallilatus TaxID=1211322 RepID=A0ABR6MZZ1_9DEIO|nr:hypothetical protein [Deinococcus metallilatus]MBB5297497.1 hypothetical protein [Deinococcus metallilatus]QBY06730.1 hypothetical protein E5F05_01935 [Deinococcus metallilatus]GMA14387.1 hypothetical protein GCM10025871_07180 [Deinococcus metallilatus]
MFNLTVSEAHTFYVGNAGWLVHNCNWTVDAAFQKADEAAGLVVDGKYIVNPTARDITTAIGPNGNLAGLNGQYMYVVTTDGKIIIGTRAGTRMPHPTLVGGSNPTVQAAGMVEIQSGRIAWVDNASGHFKPGEGSLQAAQDAFSKLPASVFSKKFQGYLPWSR